MLKASLSEELFGYTALEANLFKKLVICSNVGGLKEVVDHNLIGYVLNHNVDLFSENIIILLIDDKFCLN